MADTLVDDDIWEEPAPPKGMRLRWVTATLIALGLLAGGFWIGAVVQRHHGSTAAAGTGRRAAREAGFGGFAGAGSGAGAGGFGGSGARGGAGATDGTVIDVAGSTIEVSEASGSVVEVQVGPTTTVSRTADGSSGPLAIGDTVVVRGSAGAGGTIAASSVVATAEGVTAAGGFGAGAGAGAGGGGFGGGASGG